MAIPSIERAKCQANVLRKRTGTIQFPSKMMMPHFDLKKAFPILVFAFSTLLLVNASKPAENFWEKCIPNDDASKYKVATVTGDDFSRIIDLSIDNKGSQKENLECEDSKFKADGTNHYFCFYTKLADEQRKLTILKPLNCTHRRG